MEKLEKIALDIRKKIVKTALSGKAGHISSSMSIVEILAVLYFDNVLKYDANNPEMPERDRFILSKGHGCLALYSVLAKAGFFNEDVLNTFCKPNSNLGSHPKMDELVGIEASTGALGHGLSFGAGISIAAKVNKINYKTYVVLGDGECQEGSVWEAFMTISHFNLTNLVTIIDNNAQQASGFLRDIINIPPLKDRISSFGFEVIEIDGHNMSEIKNALICEVRRPKLIVANTIKGKGLSCMENKPEWHGRLPNEKETETILIDLAMQREELGLV